MLHNSLKWNYLTIIPLALTTMVMMSPAMAQSGAGMGGCPGGMIPGPGRCYGPTELPSSSPSRPRVSMGTFVSPRYGVFVVAQPKGNNSWESVFTRYDYSDPDQADTAALKDCSAKYGGCRVLFRFANVCAAVASGDWKESGDDTYLAVGVGLQEKNAQADALAKCTADSLGHCRTVQSACAAGALYDAPNPY